MARRAKPAEDETPISLSTADIARQIRERAQTAIVDGLNEFDTDAFARKVVTHLDAKRQAVTWKLLGLEDRWGKWEVDHCNNRTSPINDYLTAATRPLVAKWVNEAVEQVLTDEGDKLFKQAKAAVQKEVRDHLAGYGGRRQISDLVNDRVSGIIRRATDEVFDEITDKQE